VVPPAATKSHFYRNLGTREIWQQAYAALRTAKRLILVGYSLPVADLTIGGMLEDAASGRSLEVMIVNPSPEPVSDRLLGLGVSHDRIECRSGEACVEQFANEYADLQARILLGSLKSTVTPDNPGLLLAGWGSDVDMHRERIQPVVHISPPDYDGDIVVHAPTESTPISPDATMIPRLLEHISNAVRILAEARDGRRMPIVDVRLRPPTRPGELTSITLVPAGRPAALQ
jgi:hypothetical protein